MKNLHLVKLLADSGLSPEELGKRLGLSGMTLRRWIKGRPGTLIPKFYERALSDEIIRLWMDGRLREDADSVKWAMTQGQSLYFEAALKNLGLTGDFLKPGGGEDRMMLCLTQIGSSASHQKQVDGNGKKILGFAKTGKTWADRISTLTAVLKSKKLDPTDKLVAYGALFYLICPFDLIPDSVPVFGMMDDYAILGFASEYYAKRLSKKH
jgi:uncharacterized membrane protein YkvA (DUF1232 family)